MADTGPTLRGIDYRSTFPFVHLFKGFRLAIDPSKIALALAMLLILYTAGRLMDAVWPRNYRAVTNEVQLYNRDPANFKAERARVLEASRNFGKSELAARGITKDDPRPGDLVTEYRKERDRDVDAARKAFDALPADQKNDAAEDRRDDAVKSAHATFAERARAADQLDNSGLFITFITYQVDQVDACVQALIDLRFYDAFRAIHAFLITGPMWAIKHHWVFFSLFFALFLILWSVFGGAISRIAAVQVARDEKISVRQSLRFSTNKVLSFVFAPLIPIIIIVALALLLGAASALMQVPYYIGGLWSIVVGAGFFLAILAGLVMALTTIGLIGGNHLMYPTIAVEGSDSFDAVSRSFSYLYARPWQLLWYTLVALVYGAITYLFVRFFIYVLLWMTHAGVGMFMYGQAADGSPLMDSLWQAPPSLMTLSYEPNYEALNRAHDIGATLIAFWVYLTISLLGAFAISLYFSLGTIIYYLMRKEVDATAIDEVYIEPTDEDWTDTASDPVAAPAEVAVGAPLATDLPPRENHSSSPKQTPIDVPETPPVPPVENPEEPQNPT